MPVAALDEVGRPQMTVRTRSSQVVGDGHLGKPVGAVVAAARVLRTLHASERPLNASGVARAASLHRATPYNILRTLQPPGFLIYNQPTLPSSLTLHIR